MFSKYDFEDKIAKLKKLVCTVYYSNSDVTINHIIYFLKKKKDSLEPWPALPECQMGSTTVTLHDLPATETQN